MILFCNFTGIYEVEGITQNGDVLDFADLTGTNMYIDVESEREMLRCIERIGLEKYRLRFLDNGNYHYMTRIFASFIKEPFDLITFDNHTDDQQPAFEGARSCGSWRRDIASENKYLRQSALIQKTEDFPHEYVPSELPLYISIDKDILAKDVLNTNWDQGEMRQDQLLDLLERLFTSRKIIAVDVCGEDLPDNPFSQNKKFNLNLIEFVCFRHT